MQIRCPHCRNPIEANDDTSLAEVNCPTCGSSFSLITGDTTQTHRGESRRIAHFELVRELGIGNFGSVWMARDTQLDRTVAIKIPRRGALDAQETEKFLRDARAAAQLHHPNIVGVHEVGREHDTVYIVTDYIKGANLKEWLTGQRLSFRESAELLVKVAEALHHAHRAGVVHRDLKPGNVMIDGDGQPHVIDFGLARREAGEVTMTVDGHILGTPAYMSPEQAAGKGHEADRRSDVYSIGVILFELLTGELPFRGDAQMLLLQIERDEPPRPRKLNGKIPRDLETIALKCLQKEPGRRYQSAEDIALDLKRWLEGKPILARPIGRVARGWRWCRRKPVVAGLSAAVALALVSGTGVSTYFAVVATAERERAEAQATEAITERERAEEGFREARQTVDKYFTSVSESKLLNVPGLQPLRKELLESALEHYQKFIGQYAEDPKVQAEMANTYVRVGNITGTIASQEESLAAFKKAIEIWEKLVRENPAVTNYQNGLAIAYHYLGREQWDTGRRTAAEASCRRAIEIHERLARENPSVTDYQNSLARAYNSLGLMQSDDADSLGFMQSGTGRRPEAEALYKKVIEIEEKVVRENPTAINCQSDLANAYTNLGRMQRQTGRWAEAQASLKKAIEIHQKLVSENPTVGDFQSGLAKPYKQLGNLQSAMGRTAEAQTAFKTSIEIQEKLVRENPTVSKYQSELCHAYNAFGAEQRDAGRMVEAETFYRKSLDIRAKLARENPTVMEYQNQRAYASRNLGDLLATAGKWRESADLYAKTAELSDRSFVILFQWALLQLAAGDEVGYRTTCAELIQSHGKTNNSNQAFIIALTCVAGDRAVEDVSMVVALARKATQADPRNPGYWTVLGGSFYRAGQNQEAIGTLEKAIPLHTFAALAAPKQLDQIQLSRLSAETMLALAYRQQGNQELLDKQLLAVKALIVKLEQSPPKPSGGIGPWGIPFAIEMSKRELTRIGSPAAEITESDPK